MRITRGVAQYDALFTHWYGWARAEAPGYGYLEGPARTFKFVAWIDTFRVARILRRKYR